MLTESDSVFDHDDYHSYLHARLGQQGRRTGLRLQACQALGCHTTYLSQVLNEKIHISLEHAESMNQFLRHTRDESDYFVLLVQKCRAGSKSLEERFMRQLKELRAKRNSIKNRIVPTGEIKAEDKDKFYSHWLYTAIHGLVSIPRYQTPPALAEAAGVSLPMIGEALEFLQRIGLVIKRADRYVHGPQVLHLGADNVLISKHHTNWRFHAIQSIPQRASDDLHYSAVFSLNEDAAEQIRSVLLKTLEKNVATVTKAKEQLAYVYTFDFYRLDR